MDKFIRKLHAIITLIVLTISTSIFFIPIFIIGLLKLFPFLQWRVFCTQLLDNIIVHWCGFNSFYIDNTLDIKWNISGINENDLDINNWHLIIANHQSWLDIIVLQYIFTKKIPLMKFFIKDTLKWIPLLGFAWWAMGCPFMKRYSKEYLAKNPHKVGKDMEATRKATELFKQKPSTVINFIEGTRFTLEKKQAQESPYQHLLKPKAGGLSFVIGTMNEKINDILDVSIVYPHSNYSLWDFLCHNIKEITVNIRFIPLPDELSNINLVNDSSLQHQFRKWLNDQWEEKDKLIDELKQRNAYFKI